MALVTLGEAPDWAMKVPKLRALPKTPIQMTGCISEMKSWIGLLYHFLRSLCVKAQRPWRGPVFAFGGGSRVRGNATEELFSWVSATVADFISSVAIVITKNAPCSSSPVG